MPPHKGYAAVVGKQLLNANAPVGSGHQGAVGLLGLAQVADPRVQVLQGVEGSCANQDIEAVPAVGSKKIADVCELGWVFCVKAERGDGVNLQQLSFPHRMTSIP